MRRVLLFFDSPVLQSDGISSHCENLLHLFENSQSIELVKAKPIERKYSKLLRRFYYPNFKYLRRYIMHDSSEVIHVHGLASICSMQVIIASIIAKKKIVFSPHFHPFDKMNNPFLMKVYWNLMARFVISKVDCIITINNEDTSFFKKMHKNVTMIPHWSFIEDADCDNYIKKKNMILFVGRNDLDKRLDMLYDLPRNKFEVHCVTTGNVLREDFVVHSNIPLEELKQLYKKASLLVIPSRYEAFSLVALEALWYNTPIVVSDRVRIIDHLHNCKSGYFVFTYGNKSEFYEMIERGIGTLVDSKFVKDFFSEEKVRKQYVSVYSFI